MSRLALSSRLLLMTCTVLLAACSGAPSEGQMKDALQADIKRKQDQAVEAARALGGEQAAQMSRRMTEANATEVKNVHKIGCKDDGENAYRCDIEVEVSRRGGQIQKSQPFSARFVKGSDGWHAER